MLSSQSLPVIKATLPVISERMDGITPHFYRRLFEAHPELMNGLFSRSNQRNGKQQSALAGSIVAFAAWLAENPDSYPEAVLVRIANKHTSLGIVPDQYPIVYKHLFDAIAEDLGDTLTTEIADAWTEVYWLMAHALIKIEKGLYAAQANDKPWAQWRITEKRPAGSGAVTLVLEPADDTPATPGRAGQYVSLRVPVKDGLLQVRQYSLSHNAASTTSRTITTKLDDGGEVSPIVHQLQVGTVVELSNPYGEVTLGDNDGPIILASAGIGCTPAASLLHELATNHSEREVLVLHAESTPDMWALGQEMTSHVSELPNADLHVWYEQELEGFHKGFMTLEGLDIPQDASLHLCGPLPFMKSMRSQALKAGIPADRIQYEVFGPDMWLFS
ncbi:globin domain-containing protein [Arthrobacter roseus]|uniref:globin domain-containing protein n=1 Tax=Arthrobacter roseus TaxID=136274 RepID=UPI0019645597|nr:globin domain-containing protein [Arthrobacter roseus]MBM7847624.1 nitric oxide dioxygenase [Arthrobacter roseus]